MRASRKLAKPLADPIRAAFEASGMTLNTLIERAGLDITESSLSRKLSGDQSIGIPVEAEKLGRVFGLALKWTGKAFRFEKQAA